MPGGFTKALPIALKLKRKIKTKSMLAYKISLFVICLRDTVVTSNKYPIFYKNNRSRFPLGLPYKIGIIEMAYRAFHAPPRSSKLRASAPVPMPYSKNANRSQASSSRSINKCQKNVVYNNAAK